MKQVIISIVMCLSFSAFSQNVGIGTNNPEAILHVKTNLVMVTAKNEAFKEGVINPSYLEGDQDWRISAIEPHVGDFCAQAPSVLDADEIAIIRIPVSVALNKDVSVEYAIKHEDLNNNTKFEVTTPLGSEEIPGDKVGWNKISLSFISTTSTFDLVFELTGLKDSQDAQTFLDAVKVSYISDPVFKIEDGTECSGGILQSDAFGNTTWVDLRSEIDQQVNGATQTLLFRTTNNKLDISNGNQVRIPTLSNDFFKTLKLQENSLDLTPETSFTIGKAPSFAPYFHYNGENGILAWGIDNEGIESTGEYSTKWGNKNDTDGRLSTAWGQENEVQSTGINATSWGEENFLGSRNTTVFGHDNYLLNGELSTVWGKENNIQGEMSSVWGVSNTVSPGFHEGTMWGIDNTIQGHQATVWGSSNTASADSLSTVWGKNNLASGNLSTAWGESTEATGRNATSMGESTNARGRNATALGERSSANATNAIAFGKASIAAGQNSLAIGDHALATSFGEVALGMYNATLGGNPDEWEEDDTAFSIGDGNAGFLGRSNSLTIKKSGKMGINTLASTNYLEVAFNEPTLNGIGVFNGSSSLSSGTMLALTGKRQEIRFGDNSSDGFHMIYQKSSDFFAIKNDTEHYLVINDGKIGVKTTNPSHDLHLQNNSAAKPTSSSWTVASDRRLKQDVKPFEGGLDLVQKINPVWFTYNGRANMPRETGVGTIAQELEKVAPYMVTEWEREDEKYKAVDYGAMDFILVNAIKEQQEQIEKLTKLVEEQGKVIEKLLEN